MYMMFYQVLELLSTLSSSFHHMSVYCPGQKA